MGDQWRWLAMAGVLGACAYPGVDQALEAQRTLIGLPKQILLSCAGPPDRQAVMGDLDYVTYQSRRAYSHPISGGYGRPYSGEYIGAAVCEATFTMRNDVVERMVYRTASGGNWALSQCHSIVQNCLALAPQQTSPTPGARTR
jgi:hypothetical protein